MNTKKFLHLLLALSIGISITACPAKSPTTTPSPSPTTQVSTSSAQATIPAKPSEEVRESLMTLDEIEATMDAMENDESLDKAISPETTGTKSLTVNCFTCQAVGKGSSLENTVIGQNISKSPRLKKAINRAEMKVAKFSKRVQNKLNEIKSNVKREVTNEVVANPDGSITQKVVRELGAKKQGLIKTVTIERTFKDDKLIKIYHKYVMSFKNGSREATRTTDISADGSRKTIFDSKLVISGKTQTVHMEITIDSTGKETRTGKMVLFSGKEVTINTTIDSNGAAVRTCEVDGVKVELKATEDGTRTLTVQEPNQAPKTETVTNVDTESILISVETTAQPESSSKEEEKEKS